MIPQYFDIHSHVAFKDYDQDLEEVLQRMRDESVWTITVGVNKATSEDAVKFGEGKEGFFSTVGLHPNDTEKETFSESEYKSLILNPKVVGVGECGLDYYRLQRGNERDSSLAIPKQGKVESSAYYHLNGDVGAIKKRQAREFEKHIDFAIKYDKPLMIHGRPSRGTVDTYLDMLAVLESKKREVGEKLRGNIHFFVGTVDIARRFYTIGFTTSFTGVLTFAREYDDVVKFAPLEMLMTETDAPYATPNPFRGRRNEPLYVKYVVGAIASIRGIGEEVAREATVQNALKMFVPKS